LTLPSSEANQNNVLNPYPWEVPRCRLGSHPLCRLLAYTSGGNRAIMRTKKAVQDLSTTCSSMCNQAHPTAVSPTRWSSTSTSLSQCHLLVSPWEDLSILFEPRGRSFVSDPLVAIFAGVWCLVCHSLNEQCMDMPFFRPFPLQSTCNSIMTARRTQVANCKPLYVTVAVPFTKPT
jgi:hypothetical protein